MAVLVIADHDNAHVRDSTHKTMTAALKLSSDVDVLVEFEPRVASSFANFLDLKEALERLLGRPVDLVELHTIRNRRLRHYIEQSKSPVYAAA